MDAEHLTAEEGEPSRLLIFKAGGEMLGVAADEAEEAVAWRRPTPLPRAPQAVLGVVSVRGRMLTLLDPLALVQEERDGEASTFSHIIPLRGDEQLALAAAGELEVIEIPAGELVMAVQDAGSSAVLGIAAHEGRRITVLKVGELFAVAMQGTERRRKRF
ncbi:MAG TPA: chemotaxis protein CheW [Pyrinomonadaceae bacterium]